MSEAPKHEWHFNITDMIGFAENFISYTNGFDKDRFVSFGITYDATLRNLELVGEAAKN